MKLTIELDLQESPDPTHFQNFLGYAYLLDRAATNELKGLVPRGIHPVPLDVEEGGGGPRPVGRPRGRTRGATAEQAAAAVAEADAAPEAVSAAPAGLPPAAQVSQVPGLPPGVEAAAVQQAAPASVAAPAPVSGGLPPGVGPMAPEPPAAQVPVATQLPQVPSMPSPTSAPNGSALTIADVQSSYAASVKQDPAKAFGFLKSEVWPSDGSPKPRWLAVGQIPVDQYERVLMELSGL